MLFFICIGVVAIISFYFIQKLPFNIKHTFWLLLFGINSIGLILGHSITKINWLNNVIFWAFLLSAIHEAITLYYGNDFLGEKDLDFSLKFYYII